MVIRMGPNPHRDSSVLNFLFRYNSHGVVTDLLTLVALKL